MRFWSEGMGETELVMGLDQARLARTDDRMLLTGVVTSPAPWEYEVAMSFDDWRAILRTATSKGACDFIATRVRLRDLVSMAVSIAKFVALLAWFRAVRWIGASGRSPVAAPSVGDTASK